MRGAPERPQQVVTSTVVHSVVRVQRTRHVNRIRTLHRVRLWQRITFEHRERVLLQHLGHRLQQVSDVGVRQRKSKRTTAGQN